MKNMMMVVALACSALAPGALQAQGRNNAPDRRGMSQAEWTAHVRACTQQYRSYDERSDTYAPRAGVRARCTLEGAGRQGTPARPVASVDRQGMSQSQWNAHVRACKARYRSYNEQTDRYVPRAGTTARCTLR